MTITIIVPQDQCDKMAYMFNNGVVFTIDGVRLLISMLNQGSLHKNAYKDEPDKEKVKSLIEAKRQLCYDIFNKLESEYIKQKQLPCAEANGGLFNADQDDAEDVMAPVSEIETTASLKRKAMEEEHETATRLKRRAMEDEYETAARLKRKAMMDDYDTEAMLRRKALEDDPLKKSQYDLELAQTLLATEKVKREAAALAAKAAKPAKATRKERPLAEAAVIVPPLVDKLPQPAQPALAEAAVIVPLVDKLPQPAQPALAEAAVIVPPLVDEPPPPVDIPPQALVKPQKSRPPPRMPPSEVWENMSYEEKKAARRLQVWRLQELRNLGVAPTLTDAAISRAAAVRKAHQDYLAAKKLFDECPLDSADRERLSAAAAAADRIAAGKRVPPILDPRCTEYCERCHGHSGGICPDHRLKFDARTQDPAELYAKAGRC